MESKKQKSYERRDSGIQTKIKQKAIVKSSTRQIEDKKGPCEIARPLLLGVKNYRMNFCVVPSLNFTKYMPLRKLATLNLAMLPVATFSINF